MSDDQRVAVVVLAAVIEQQDRFLVTRRLAHTHLAGVWEFPGGKCEPGETHDACLKRELVEELGVETSVGEEIASVEHHYPDRTVRLHFRRCAIAGEPRALLGQQIRWVTRDEMKTMKFPEADRKLIEILAT